MSLAAPSDLSSRSLKIQTHILETSRLRPYVTIECKHMLLWCSVPHSRTR